jgi:hypothetical protein
MKRQKKVYRQKGEQALPICCLFDKIFRTLAINRHERQFTTFFMFTKITFFMINQG